MSMIHDGCGPAACVYLSMSKSFCLSLSVPAHHPPRPTPAFMTYIPPMPPPRSTLRPWRTGFHRPFRPSLPCPPHLLRSLRTTCTEARQHTAALPSGWLPNALSRLRVCGRRDGETQRETRGGKEGGREREDTSCTTTKSMTIAHKLSLGCRVITESPFALMREKERERGRDKDV